MSQRLNQVLVIFFFLLFALTPKIQAENMSSDSYYLQFGNFNMSAGEEGSASYNLTHTAGASAMGPYGQYGSSGYFIGSGFQYIYQIDTFEFSISKLSIDLGTLSAGSFGTDSHTLTITTDGASGYKVYAFEQHPLQHDNNPSLEIADTVCDSSDCDETVAGIWTNTSTVGFGFNMTGDDVASDFTNSNFFRQFADASNSESMQEIMGSSDVALGDTSTVNYQATINGTQEAGNYLTSIVFVAVPGY